MHFSLCTRIKRSFVEETRRVSEILARNFNLRSSVLQLLWYGNIIAEKEHHGYAPLQPKKTGDFNLIEVHNLLAIAIRSGLHRKHVLISKVYFTCNTKQDKIVWNAFFEATTIYYLNFNSSLTFINFMDGEIEQHCNKRYDYPSDYCGSHIQGRRRDYPSGYAMWRRYLTRS